MFLRERNTAINMTFIGEHNQGQYDLHFITVTEIEFVKSLNRQPTQGQPSGYSEMQH